MNEQVCEYLQNDYEEILSSYWHKILAIRELEDTNKNNSPLRLKSINDRKKELVKIIAKKDAYQLIYEDYISVPQWYIDILKKHSINTSRKD